MPLVDVLRAAISEIEQYERVVLNVQPGIVVVGQAVNDAVHLVAEIVENATTFSPEDTQVYVSGQPLSSGGVLLDITDNGVGISDQEMSHANWRLDNPPVVDVAVSRRMGLFVVGRLAARHGVRVRLRHAQAGGLTALIWLPDTVAAPEVAPPLGRLRRFEADDYGPAASLSAPTATAPPDRRLPGHGGREDPQVLAHGAQRRPRRPRPRPSAPVRGSRAPGFSRRRRVRRRHRARRRRPDPPAWVARAPAHPANRARARPPRAAPPRATTGSRPATAGIWATAGPTTRGRRPRRCPSATATRPRRRTATPPTTVPSHGPRLPAARAARARCPPSAD